MLIFPLLYISAFFTSIKDILQRSPQGGFFFLIFGLSIYNSTLSILFDFGLKSYIPFFQPLKEIIILGMLGSVLWNLKEKLRLHAIDYCILAYFLYTFSYVILPIGSFNFMDRLLAFKSTSFFPLIYFTGRLIDPKIIYIKKYFHYILIVAIAAAALVIFEVITDKHFQSLTGYSDYVYYFFGQEVEGNYGLTWTFERAEGGVKRFASFFSDPLEHASATLLSLSVIAGLFTNRENKFNVSTLGIVALVATLISMTFSISRSSLASYFFIIYVYAIIAKKKQLLVGCNTFIMLCMLYVTYILADKDVFNYIISTLTLQDESGMGHWLAWLAGLEAIISNPFGLGLGTSGRVAVSLGTTIGGENQFIILGVQVGIIAVLLYVFLHFAILFYTYKWYPYLDGKERSVALTLFLFKAGSTLPLITANLDSYSYITYISWFLAGLFINMIMRKEPPRAQSVKSYEQ
jgi:hypothetical protein